MWIRCKGTPENRILIGPLGNGEVIIDASEKIEGWQLHKGDIYKAPCLFEPAVIVVDEEVKRGKVSELLSYFGKTDARGEFSVVVSGSEKGN